MTLHSGAKVAGNWHEQTVSKSKYVDWGSLWLAFLNETLRHSIHEEFIL